MECVRRKTSFPLCWWNEIQSFKLWLQHTSILQDVRSKKTKMIMLSRTWRKEAGRRERELFSSQQGFSLAKQPTPLKVVGGEKEQCVQQGDRHCTGDKYKIIATTECRETENKRIKSISLFPWHIKIHFEWVEIHPSPRTTRNCQ